MISKLSFDSMLEFQLCYHKQLFILKCTKIEKIVILNCIFDQINAALETSLKKEL